MEFFHSSSSDTNHGSDPPLNSSPLSLNTQYLELSSLARALNFNLPIKLDKTNFINKRAQVLAAIRALELDDYKSSVPYHSTISYPQILHNQILHINPGADLINCFSIGCS